MTKKKDITLIDPLLFVHLLTTLNTYVAILVSLTNLKIKIICTVFVPKNTLKRIRNATSKFKIKGFHSKIMTMMYISMVTYITWLPFMFVFAKSYTSGL